MKTFIELNGERLSILAFALLIGITANCSSAADGGGRANENANSGMKPNSAIAENKRPETTETAQTKEKDGLPKFAKEEDYKSSVRVRMLKAGWKPAPTEDSEKCGSGDSRCDEYPELESCAGTGMGNCKFLWKGNDKTVAIFAVDDPYLFSSYEFEKAEQSTQTINITGKYIATSTHEYGTDRFIYELKNNNVAAYTSEMEGDSGENKIGAWGWDEANKTITITFPPQKRDEAKGIDEDVPEETFVFKLEDKNLKMTKEPRRDAGYVGFKGAVFKKQYQEL